MWKGQQIVLSGKIKTIRQKIVKSEILILMHKKIWSGRCVIV